MGAPFKGGPVTITASAQSLTTGLALGQNLVFSHMAIRADKANAGRVWLGLSNVTTTTNQLGFIDAGEAFEVALERVYSDTGQLYLIGTAADKVYIAMVQ